MTVEKKAFDGEELIVIGGSERIQEIVIDYLQDNYTNYMLVPLSPGDSREHAAMFVAKQMAKNEEEQIQIWLNDPLQKKRAADNAKTLWKVYGGSWFQSRLMERKFDHMTKKQIVELLAMLEMFGYVEEREEEAGLYKSYRILLSPQLQLENKEKEKQILERKMNAIVTDIERLNEEIKPKTVVLNEESAVDMAE